MEFFAGEANVFKAIRADYTPGIAIDINYLEGKDHAMNILTDSGFAFYPKIQLFRQCTVWFEFILECTHSI